MRLVLALVCPCALALADEPDGAKTVPAFTMTSQRVATPSVHLPQSFVDSFDQPTATGDYKLCVGVDGHVARTSVLASVGKPYADDDLTKQVRETWTYKPRTAPVCFVQRFQFNVRHGRPAAEGDR